MGHPLHLRCVTAIRAIGMWPTCRCERRSLARPTEIAGEGLAPALPSPSRFSDATTMAYAEVEKALATRAAYASDWRDFAAWCASKGATSLPGTWALSPPICPGLLIAAANRPPSAAVPSRWLPAHDGWPRAADQR